MPTRTTWRSGEQAPPSDALLLAATARGDALSFEQLHRRHAPACRRRALRVLATHEWVQDVVQAVFLDVWRHAGRFDGRSGSARGWLLALTHHKAVDLVRQQERHNSRWAHEGLLDGHLDTGRGPERAAADADTSARLRASLELLPTAQGDALRLCFFADRTQAEAAVELGVPLGTVKTRSRAGVIALRDVTATSLAS